MSASRFSSIEPLEARIAPASIIDVVVKGGVLTLKTSGEGDGDDGVRLSGGAATVGTYLVDAEPGTQLRFNGVLLADGASQSVTGVTKGISVSLGAGADTVTIDNFYGAIPVTVNLGAGNNQFSVPFASVASLAYVGGKDGDEVELDVLWSTGKVAAALGEGTNSLIFGEVSANSDVTVTGGAGVDTITGRPREMTIGGKLTVNLGAGANSLTLPNSLTVLRDATFTTGAGNDVILINTGNGLSGGGVLSVGGNLTVASGKGDDDLRLAVTGTLNVGKNLSLSSLGQVLVGDDVQQIIAATQGLSVLGKLSLASGPVDSLSQTVTASGRDLLIGGAVSLTGGAVNSVQSIFSVGAVMVGGGVTMTIKNLPDVANSWGQSINTALVENMMRSAIQGAVTMTGASSVQLKAPGDIFGAVKITTAVGAAATVEVGEDAIEFEGRLHSSLTIKTDTKTLASSVSVDRFTLGGALSITTAGGADTVNLRDVIALGIASIITGDGADTVNVENNSTLYPFARYQGAMIFKTGKGIDTINLGGSSGDRVAIFLGKVTLDTGAEEDNVNIAGPTYFMVPVVNVS